MAKFLKRALGNYQERELVVSLVVEKFNAKSKEAYSNVFVEFKRGDKQQRLGNKLNIPAGESSSALGLTFSTYSTFY